MADVTIKRFDELESYRGEGGFSLRRHGPRRGACGDEQSLQLPAGWSDYPDHDHAKDGPGGGLRRARGKRRGCRPATRRSPGAGLSFGWDRLRNRSRRGPNGVTLSPSAEHRAGLHAAVIAA